MLIAQQMSPLGQLCFQYLWQYRTSAKSCSWGASSSSRWHGKKLTDDKLKNSCSKTTEVFTELYFKKLVRRKTRESFTELVTVTGHHNPFFSTDRMIISLEIGKNWNAKLLLASSVAAALLRAHPYKKQWIRIISSRSWPRCCPPIKDVILPAVESVVASCSFKVCLHFWDVATKESSTKRASNWAVKRTDES